jgi:hypothetical protein
LNDHFAAPSAAMESSGRSNTNRPEASSTELGLVPLAGQPVEPFSGGGGGQVVHIAVGTGVYWI